ncbi:MAG: glycosyltransferase [Actinobacteria bacterium]|nr:glycosyltransferase [Actinomycetota bacterium]
MACKRSGVQFPSAPPMTMVAVVMRTYERPVLLARAIASVQQQTLSDWHLVIVNNGGDPAIVDNVVRIAQQSTTSSSGTISVLHLDARVGMEEASNRGLAATTSEFFVIHDDDDSWDERFLEVSVKAMGSHESAAAVVTGITRIHETFRGGSVWPVMHEDFYLTPGRLTLRGMIGNNTFPPIAALFRRRVISQVGEFDASLPVLGDWEFNLRAVTTGEFVYIPEKLARYHTRTSESDSASGNSITIGEDLHRSVKLQLQDRWLQEPAVNGVNKGLLSMTASTATDIEETQGGTRTRVDVEQIANRTAQIIALQSPLRRVVRGVLHPRHGVRAIVRRLRRIIGK